jgi:dienelactone hydrolase
MTTLYWREPPRRDPRDFETFVEFGRGRRSGRGFMAYSERAGPGVLVLHPAPSWPDPVLDFARAVHGDGFTVLVPDAGVDGGDGELERVAAAADYLADNWHPRLGIVGFGAAAVMACRLAGARECDALVLYGGSDANRFEGPLLSHKGTGSFIDSHAEGFGLSEARTAHERTLEFLHYHLS